MQNFEIYFEEGKNRTSCTLFSTFLMTILRRQKHGKKKEINIVRKSPIDTHIVYINNKGGHIVFFVWPQEIEGLISAFTCTALFPQEGKRCAPIQEHLHACLI